MSENIVVPEVGESIVDARVAKWLKKEGDAVTAGEALVELETDKVDVEVAAPRSGVIEKILHGDGDDVKIGDVIGLISGTTGTTGTSGTTGTKSGASAAASSGPSPEQPSPEQPSPAKPAPAKARSAPAATPSARRMARERDVALSDVKTEGPRVTKEDVERSLDTAPAARPTAAAPPSPSPAGDRRETRERMSKRRATIARRLVEAQQTAAMLTTFNEVDMTAVMARRERHKESFKARYGTSLGIASFFVKGVVTALREVPRLNAEIQGDEMVLKHYYDIGMAVAAEEGLVVPVLRDADCMSFATIETAIRRFAGKAKDGTLTLDDIRGGSFSITNGGVFGSLMSTPILNPPQVAILGLHAIRERPSAQTARSCSGR